MSSIDIVIIVVLILFTFLGGRRGLVNELLGLTGWILAFLVAIALCDYPASLLHSRVPTLGFFSTLISIVVILLLMRVLLRVVANSLQTMVTNNKSSALNFSGGSFLGFVQGLFLLSVVVLLITVIPLMGAIKNRAQDSVLFRHTELFSVYVVNTVARYIPRTKKAIDSIVDKLEKPSQSLEKVKKEAEQKINAQDIPASQQDIEKQIMEELKKIRRNREELRR